MAWPTYNGDRESDAACTNSAFGGSDRSTANRYTSSAARMSAESIFTSQRLKPYGTSSEGNCTVARPAAGTCTMRVEIVFPLITSVDVRIAWGVAYPATTA